MPTLSAFAVAGAMLAVGLVAAALAKVALPVIRALARDLEQTD